MKRAVNALQNFGKSLYGPVLILPIVGLFIAFGIAKRLNFDYTIWTENKLSVSALLNKSNF